MAEFYRCAQCEGAFTNKDVEVDHITPVVDPKLGFVSWDTYINRLFSAKGNYQVLCKTCHTAKSNEEKKVKKNVRKK